MTKTIEVSDELYETIKDKLGDVKEIFSYEDLVGGKYYFRTVTYHTVGEVKKIVGRFAYLKSASWVADSGRFMNAIKDGTLNEVEPVGDAFVNLDTVVDFFPWKHTLKIDQK
ncbi:MAG: hypothetical protein ACP5N7_03320 [Candidatus Pacearchaeota archaeon]